MEQKTDLLTGFALMSRLKAYYTLLPKGYVDTLVGMAIADTTGNPPKETLDKGYAPCGPVITEAEGSV
jgi:hypothetical protein